MIGAKEYAEMLLGDWVKDQAVIMLFAEKDSVFLMPHGEAFMTVNKKSTDISKSLSIEMLAGFLEKANSGTVFRKQGRKMKVEFIYGDYLTGKVVTPKEAEDMMDDGLWKVITTVVVEELDIGE